MSMLFSSLGMLSIQQGTPDVPLMSMLCSSLSMLSIHHGAPDVAGGRHGSTTVLPDARLQCQHCCRHLHAAVCHQCLQPSLTSKMLSSPSAAAAVNDSPVMLLSGNCCPQDARVLQQQLATESSLRQNAIEDYRAMQSQLVALSGDLDASQQKQRALQQQLAVEQVGSWASFEAVE